jgi:hypothetical protein
MHYKHRLTRDTVKLRSSRAFGRRGMLQKGHEEASFLVESSRIWREFPVEPHV